MSTQTEKLGLFKYDPVIDKEELFDIQTSLNDNWDKIDAAINSDWNQNDESAPDYVKNRPGGYMGEELIEVFKDITVTIDSDGGSATNYDIYVANWHENQIIVWDGVEYRCKLTSGISIGGLDEYPFEFFENPVDGYTVISCATAGTHTFSVYGIEEVPVPIDEKFLPDTVATKEYVTESVGAVLPSVTSDDNGKFLRVVDGVPAWTAV